MCHENISQRQEKETQVVLQGVPFTVVQVLRQKRLILLYFCEKQEMIFVPHLSSLSVSLMM